MSKKIKILITMLATVVLLVLVGAATVMAQNDETTPHPDPEALMMTANTTGLPARVADILGISSEELVGAFKQAHQERLEGVFDKMLDKIVEKEGFIQEEVDAIKQWWVQKPETQDESLIKAWLEQKPEVSHPGLLMRILKAVRQNQLPGRAGARHLGPSVVKAADILGIPKEDVIAAFKQAQQEKKLDLRDKMLEKAVEKGLITSEEAGEIKSWWESKPAALDRLAPGAHISRVMRGWQQTAVSKGWGGLRLR